MSSLFLSCIYTVEALRILGFEELFNLLLIIFVINENTKFKNREIIFASQSEDLFYFFCRNNNTFSIV